MKNFSIVVPSNNKAFQIKKAIKDLKVFFASTEYSYELIFVYGDNLVNKFKNNVDAIVKENNIDVEFVANCKSVNKLIKKGIEVSNGEAVITLDFERSNWRDILIGLISSYEKGNNVVLTKFQKNKLSVRSFFARGFSCIVSCAYKLTLKMLGMKEDCMAENMYQLFDADVIDVMRELPDKNEYLRNYNVWAGLKTEILTLRVEKDTSIVKDMNYNGMDFILFLTFGVLFIASVVLAIVLANNITDGISKFNYIILSLATILTFFAVSNFFLVKDVIKQRADYPKTKK